MNAIDLVKYFIEIYIFKKQSQPMPSSEADIDTSGDSIIQESGSEYDIKDGVPRQLNQAVQPSELMRTGSDNEYLEFFMPIEDRFGPDAFYIFVSFIKILEDAWLEEDLNASYADDSRMKEKEIEAIKMEKIYARI